MSRVTLRTARYAVPLDPPRLWTARLCLDDNGCYWVDYALPSGGSQRRTRAVLPDPALFEEWVAERIPAEVQAALAPQVRTLGDGDPLLADLFAWYTDDVMVARGDAAISRERNGYGYRRFTDWLAARDVLTAGELAEQSHLIESYAAWLATECEHGQKAKRRGLRPNTVRRELAILRAAFRIAAVRGVIPAEPVREWPLPKRPEHDYSGLLTPGQLGQILARMESVESTVLNVARFVAFVACRPCDACGLLRDRVSIEGPEPTALIRQQKTGNLVSVALSAPAVQAIRDELARGLPGKHVFLDWYGKPFAAGTVVNTFRYHCRELGIEASIKHLRQMGVSYLLADGVDQEYIRKITGHRSDALGAYVKTVRGAAHAAANRLAGLIGTGKLDTET